MVLILYLVLDWSHMMNWLKWVDCQKNKLIIISAVYSMHFFTQQKININYLPMIFGLTGTLYFKFNVSMYALGIFFSYSISKLEKSHLRIVFKSSKLVHTLNKPIKCFWKMFLMFKLLVFTWFTYSCLNLLSTLLGWVNIIGKILH